MANDQANNDEFGCFWKSKKIDPRLQKQNRLDKSTNASKVHKCGPFVLMILYLNVEALSTNKICFISQSATRHKALVILLQETHCTNAHQVVIPHFTLAAWVLSRKPNLATFVHEKLSWTLADQSSERSAIEWLFCVDIYNCKIVNVYKPPTSQPTLTAISVFPYPCLDVGYFNCQLTD